MNLTGKRESKNIIDKRNVPYSKSALQALKDLIGSTRYGTKKYFELEKQLKKQEAWAKRLKERGPAMTLQQGKALKARGRR